MFVGQLNSVSVVAHKHVEWFSLLLFFLDETQHEVGQAEEEHCEKNESKNVIPQPAGLVASLSKPVQPYEGAARAIRHLHRECTVGVTCRSCIHLDQTTDMER